MRIGVDATSWANKRGYGRYTRALLTAAVELDRRNEYTFFTDFDDCESPLPQGVKICRVATRVPATEAASADGHRSVADLWAMARAIRSAHLDLIYFPTDYTYVPFFTDVPRLVTIHDTISEQFPGLVFPTLRSKVLYRAKIRSGIRQAKLLITVSEFSRRQLIEKLKIPESRLRVVSEAADLIFRPAPSSTVEECSRRWDIPPTAQCLIYVGGFSPHKNLSMLLDAFQQLVLRDGSRDLRLVMVGDHTGDSFYSCYAELAGKVKSYGLGSKVLFTGRLGDEDLLALLNRSDALVLPSFCEGFGLPAVEAAACGKAVLATTESPLQALLGEGMIAISPSEPGEWVAAMERVLSDTALRERMSAAALAAASRLSWKNSASQLLSVFDEVRGNGAAA